MRAPHLLGVAHEVAEGIVALPHTPVKAAEAQRLPRHVKRRAVVAAPGAGSQWPLPS